MVVFLVVAPVSGDKVSNCEYSAGFVGFKNYQNHMDTRKGACPEQLNVS